MSRPHVLHDTNSILRQYSFTEYDGKLPVIAMDLDEVIWSVMPSYLLEVSKLTGISYTMEDLTEYSISNSLGVSEDIVHHVLHKTDAFVTVYPYLFAGGLVRMLRDGVINRSFGLGVEPHYIAFITHRGFRPDGFVKTLDLLKKFGIIPDTLIAAPMSKSKLDVLDDLYEDRVVMMFEDHPGIINDCLKASIPVTKHLQPWNKDIWTDYSVDLSIQMTPM